MALDMRQETTIVTDRRIYSTDQPIQSHIILKRIHRIPEVTYNRALHAVYTPGDDFLSLTEDALYYIHGDNFGRLYDYLDAKYPEFGMQTRVRLGMWSPIETVGNLYGRYVGFREGEPEPLHTVGFSEELMCYHQRRPVRVRSYRRRR